MNEKIDSVKNIIISTHDSLYPIKGGGALRTLKVAYEFKKRGYNVKIVAPTNGVNRNKIHEINGIEISQLRPPKKQHSQVLSAIKFNFRLLKRYLPFIKNTDIFFIHNTIAAIFLPFLKKVFKFKFVLDITDIHAEYLPIGKRNIFEKILIPYLLKYEYFIIKSADFIAVATKAMKELLISKGIASGKIEVVYDGVYRENFPQQKEPDAEYGIIHLGAIDRQHGVELLVEAIPFVIKEFPKARFFFVGGGRELPNIKKLAKELGIFDRCIFTDWLPCKEAREFLKKATIGIIPRRDNLPNRIITTLKIYEYWASKTAVISSPLEGIKEIASNNEDILWFQSGNAQDLGRTITLLLKDKELKERLIKAGLVTANKFNIAESASKIVDFTLALDT